MTNLRLDIGCGLHTKEPLDEWIHLDCDEGPHIEMVCDFGDIDLPDESVCEIHIGDVIEHVPVWRQAEVLGEWHRILKPGGILGGNTPSLEYNVQKYARGEIDLNWLLQNLYGDRAGYPHQHYILFTKETLTELLTYHGFTAIDFGGSPGPNHEPWWLVFKAVRL